MNPRRIRGAAILATVLGAWAAGPAAAQDEVRNFKKPVLVVETDGHHAPVRSLIWRDPATLFSGGLDKVVKAWDFREGPRLSRSIRPMIWRGPVGVIYALAMTPRPDAQGQSLLAVAGYGVESRRGDITVYRVPGLSPAPTGEVVARLLPPTDAQPIGHRDSVLTLAFDPNGRILASAGNDGTVILWDASTFRPLRTLAGHSGPIRTLGFLPPDGARLASAGEDGSLRIWDVANGVEVLPRLDGNPQAPVIINAMAVSPNGSSIVIGRENGDLFRLDPRNLGLAPGRLPTLPAQGPVEALAYSPDGRRLAVSIKSDRADTPDPTRLACDLEIRAMPAGNITYRRRVPGLVQAVAFSPDGKQLAYSGGMAQAVYVQELANLQAPPAELKGQGSTVFDLGFGANDQVIGFTRESDPARLPAIYEGFDLSRRRSTTVSRDLLRRAIRAYQGWTLSGSVNAYRLEAVNVNGQRWRVDLDPSREGLWWSHTFVPPGPGHPRATLAVGCGSGVVVFDLQTGRRTRFFAGHSSPVVSVVPSVNGRWLASSSVDQTVMFYPLAGSDTRPVLGATFRKRADGSWAVASVVPRGFAAAMGLLVGDVVVEARTGTRPANAAGDHVPRRQDYKTSDEVGEFVNRVANELAPNDEIGIQVRRTLLVPMAGPVELVTALPSSKRDNPALTLMQDVGREWVLWTPQGYYDTSIEGDTRLLGWHVNPSYDQSKPTDFVPIGTFARTMYRPEVLDRLWATQSLDQALAVVPAATERPDVEAAEQTPPRIAFLAIDPGIKLGPGGVWESNVPNPKIRLRITAEGKSKVASRQVVLDERLFKPSQAVGPTSDYQEDVQVDLPPDRRVRLLVLASNDSDRPRSESIDLLYRLPPPPAPQPMPRPVPAPAPSPPPVLARLKPRLIMLGMGSDTFPGDELPAVPHADHDVEGLAGFLTAHILAADGTRPDPNMPGGRMVLTSKLGKPATAQLIRESLDYLGDLLRKKELRPGEVVAVVVASHALVFNGSDLPRIAAADARLDNPSETMIPAEDLSELLGQLSDYGCRVTLFLDAVHEGTLPPTARAEIKAWVRDLQQNRRVITFVASKEGPGGIAAREQHGVFALGVLNAFQASGAAAGRKDRSAPYTLEQFRTAVVQEVLNLSNRQQEAGCYIPRGVQPWTPFAKP